MKARAELDEIAKSLRAREAAGEAVDPRTEGLHLRRSGHSMVETMVILATGLSLPLREVQELVIQLPAPDEDPSP